MATGKITKRTLDALQAGAVTGFLWDDELKGFGAKITAGGSASYVVQYRMGGREAKTRRYTIGGHGSPWTLFTAREEATRLSASSPKGSTPSNRTSSDGARLSTSPFPPTPIASRRTAKGKVGRRS